MTTVSPVQNNNGYSLITDTVVSANTFTTLLQDNGFALVQILEGTFTPTAAGNYAVINDKGGVVQIPNGSVIVSVATSAKSLLTADQLVGGTNIQPVLSATSGGGAGTALSAVVATATANATIGAAQAVTNTVVPNGNNFLSGTTTGTYTAGNVRIKVAIIDMSP